MTYKDLKVWQKADELALEIYKITKAFLQLVSLLACKLASLNQACGFVCTDEYCRGLRKKG
jgi:hypothetical protein